MEEKYSHGCDALINYSQALMQVRIMTVAQGFTVLGSVAYLINEKLYHESLAAAVFGILLTYILMALHDNYYTHFGSMLDWVIECEGEEGGPWTHYRKGRRRVGRGNRKLILHHGTFILLYFSLSALICYNIYLLR